MEARLAAFGSANVAVPPAETTGKKSSAVDTPKEHRKKRSKKHSSKKRKRKAVSAPLRVRDKSSSDSQVPTTNNMMRAEELPKSKKRRREKQKKVRNLCDKILTESDRSSSNILLEPDPDTPYEFQVKWATLLTSRPDAPKDSDEMAKWLMQVMSASDKTLNYRRQKQSSHPVGSITLKSSAKLNLTDQDLSASTVKDSFGSASDVLSGSTSENVSSPQPSCHGDEEEEDRKPPAALKISPTHTATAAQASSTSSNDSTGGDVSMLSATFAEWKQRKKNTSST